VRFLGGRGDRSKNVKRVKIDPMGAGRGVREKENPPLKRQPLCKGQEPGTEITLKKKPWTSATGG